MMVISISYSHIYFCRTRTASLPDFDLLKLMNIMHGLPLGTPFDTSSYGCLPWRVLKKVVNQWSLCIDLWTLKHDRMFQRSGCDGWWTKMEQGCWGDVVLVSALIKERFLRCCMRQYMSTTQLATSPPKWSIAKASQICKNPIPSHVSNRNINIHQIIMGSSGVVFPNKFWGLETPFWTHKCQGTEGQNHLTTTTTLSWLRRFRISTFKAP